VNIFAIRDRLISDCASYVRGFLEIRDPRIREYVEGEVAAGLLWPGALIQLNHSKEVVAFIEQVADRGALPGKSPTILEQKLVFPERPQ
jgi:hypothetical protein